MRRLRLLVLIAIVAAAALWSAGWGKNTGHRFGDPLLAREMMYAGNFFAEHGWATFGLPVYRPGALPYTHLTPGPEWIQAVFAVTRPSALPSVQWHSAATALMSMGCLLWIGRSLRIILRALETGGEMVTEAGWCGVVLIGATPAFLLYSAHPYCAAMLLANAGAFAASAVWAGAPDVRRWPGALLGCAIAVTASFWLGAAPVVSAVVWLAAFVWRFGDRENVRRRMSSFLIIAAAVLVVCTVLKLFQSALLLGSWTLALDDARSILERRAGVSSTLPFGESLPVRILYLYGLGVPLLFWLCWRNRERVKAEWPLLCAIGAGGLAWQVVMRGHAAFHIYMLRESLVPMAFAVAVLSSFDRTGRSLRIAYWVSLAEVAGVIAFLIVPLVIRGEPLWRLR